MHTERRYKGYYKALRKLQEGQTRSSPESILAKLKAYEDQAVVITVPLGGSQ